LSRESVVAAKNIADVWNHRAELISEILHKLIQNELNLDNYPDDNDIVVGKPFNNDVSLVFWFEEAEIAIGFSSDNKFDKQTRTKLDDILNQSKQLNKYFDAVVPNESEIYQYFRIDDFDGTVDEMKQILVEKYTLLEKSVTKNC
jgi:hypothetical protein